MGVHGAWMNAQPLIVLLCIASVATRLIRVTTSCDANLERGETQLPTGAHRSNGVSTRLYCAVGGAVGLRGLHLCRTSILNTGDSISFERLYTILRSIATGRLARKY